jgi:16S rRNA processing protein RimM
MARAETLEVGRIVKPVGLKGQVVVAFTSTHPDRVATGAVFDTSLGPLTIVASSHERSAHLVTFAEITSREEAETFRGVVLFAEPLDDDDVIWIDELFGAEVVDQEGVTRGVVVEVEANPASDLMVLDTGHLVPLTFVVKVEPGQRVEVEVPEGLFS